MDVSFATVLFAIGVATSGPCSYPPKSPATSDKEAVLDMKVTCSPSSEAEGVELSVASTARPGSAAQQRLYTDTRRQIYDMSSSASFTNANSVKVATIPRSTELANFTAMIGRASAAGAGIVLMTEEDFGGGDGNGEPIDGPGLTAVRGAAKQHKITVICPFRLQTGTGGTVKSNAVVVVLPDGSIANATFTGASHYEKNYPVLGWPVAAPSKGGFKVQAGEPGVVAGRTGVQVWDLPTVGRVAVLTCFDVNFYELWHQAYALGAKIVFWPSMMKSNDRDAISHARLFRFNVVANGFPGAVIDNTGKFAKDTTHHSNGMVTGTLDLDGEWAHENGPGKIICPAVAKICAKYPGVFEFAVGGCHGVASNLGCALADNIPAGEDTATNAIFLLRSTDYTKATVQAAFKEFGVVSFRDYLAASRQGLNSLRQAGAPIPEPD